MLDQLREGFSKAVTRRVVKRVGRRVQLGRATLSQRERQIVLAVARTAIPGGAVVPEPDETTLDRLESQLGRLSPTNRAGFRTALWSLEMWPMARRLRPFTRLTNDQRLGVLSAWHNASAARRLTLRALLSPIKMAHFDDRRIFEAMECRYGVEVPSTVEPARWRRNILPLPEMDEDETLEAEVVVIGTGAGGAVVAKELAEKGFAVAMVEAGRYFDRKDFDGRPAEALAQMYTGGGAVFSLGAPPILIPTGKTVGGSTTINSGTCLRVPDRILHRWRREHGLREFSPEVMAPYFERVESILQVAPAEWAHLGGCARVVERGCNALGYTRHGPLPRNAPECDGQGLCCFGCPTDAKRSTNVSYVPMALRSHATLFSQARVKEILVENGRACGVVAHARAGVNGSGAMRRLTIRAKVVVVACGTYGTPALLLHARLANSSGQLGRHLTLHPATAVMAEFDEPINGWKAIPQGYSISEFHDQRMMFEGGFTPLDLGAAALPFFGPSFTRAIERFNHLAVFGFMVEDTSRGRVRLGPDGRPIVLYNVNDEDLAVIHRGIGILSEIYFAAGARKVYPPVHGHEQLNGLRDLEAYRRSTLRALDLSLSAYHPLGTARMGANRRTSVVGPDHETHDMPGLYIVDGSSVPSSLGVNPQVTIMAMATRAADILAERLG